MRPRQAPPRTARCISVSPKDQEFTLCVNEDSTGPAHRPLKQRLPGVAAADPPGQLSNVQAELKGGNALLQNTRPKKGRCVFQYSELMRETSQSFCNSGKISRDHT